MSRLLEALFHRRARTVTVASPLMLVESVKNLPLMSVPPVEDRLFAYMKRSSAQEQLGRFPSQRIGSRPGPFGSSGLILKGVAGAGLGVAGA